MLDQGTTSKASPDLSSLLLLMKSGRFAELEIQAMGLLEHYPSSGSAWKLLGVAQWKLGKDSLPALETAARLLPRDAEARCNLGNILRARGQLKEAAAQHRTAISIDARYAEAHNNLGSVLRDLGRFDDAAASFRRAIALQPAYAMAHQNLGLALHDLGMSADALPSIRRAIVLEPDYPQAHATMADILQGLGRFEDAVVYYRQALQRRPNDAGKHQSLGVALLRLRRLEDAATCFEKALELDPRLAEAHNNLGNTLRELGKIDAAADKYRYALTLEPNSAAAHCNLGNVLIDQGAWEQAVDSYRRAIAIDPTYVKAFHNLGNVLRLLNRANEAEACYRRGLELDFSSPEILSSLADLHADRGSFDAAEDMYRQAASSEAGCPRAWAGIASLRKMTRTDSPWLEQAERIAAQLISPREEVHLRFAMGKFCDDLKQFDDAFGHYERANELTKGYRPPHDRSELTRKFDLLAEFYDRDWIDAARAGGDDSQRPVLIVGMPRSGTSLAEQILASHAGVFGAGELPFWNLSSVKIAAATLRGVAAATALKPLTHEYLRLLAEHSSSAVRVIDKMPANFAYLGLVHAAFPNCRVIHMHRYPADTCLSIYFQNFHLVYSYANDLGDIAHYYAEYLRIMDHWKKTLPPGSILDVPYEALIDNPETWSRKMIEFMGLPWDPACLEFDRTSRNVSTFSRWQVRQKINNSSVHRWRNYREHISPLSSLTEPPATTPH